MLAMPWVRLIALEQCRRDGGTFVECAGRELAVFRAADEAGVHVLDNACPHASGNLSGGELANGTVTCPWHHWTFDLATGQCTHSPLAQALRYPARVQDGEVWANLPRDG